MQLHACQSAALEYVTEYARKRRASARLALEEVLTMSNIDHALFERAVASLCQHARVALHFHPDRPDARGHTVAEGLLTTGLYKNQFETKLSNGSVSAFPGGQRDLWEHKLYGGAYHGLDVTSAHRPKYGALDLMRHPDGPAPRFGSCYFLLAAAVSRRTTFTYMDSHRDPDQRGTYAAFDDILAALFSEVFERDSALGERDLTPRRLLDQLLDGLVKPLRDPATRAPQRNLNHYIEAQVHGDVRLSEDVDILVADPSFRGTEIGELLQRMCAEHDIACHWHAGFELPVSEVPSHFRGPTMPSLAARVAVGGTVNAAAIGCAARSLQRAPTAWSDRGTHHDVSQELKRLWHVLVRYGVPASSAR